MSERDNRIKAIVSFEELEKKVDNYDRYNYYLNLEGTKRHSLIVMELIHTGNGYINGSYINTHGYETTKAGDVNIKNLSDDIVKKLIEEAIQNIKSRFRKAK